MNSGRSFIKQMFRKYRKKNDFQVIVGQRMDSDTLNCGRCAGTGRLLNGSACSNCGGDGTHEVDVIAND